MSPQSDDETEERLLRNTNSNIKPNNYNNLLKLLYLLTFIFFGPILIVLNSKTLQNFPYPILLSFFGQLTTFMFTFILYLVGKIKINVNTRFFVNNIMPLSVCSAGALIFGNMLYLYISVSFAQMLKSFTPLVLLLLLYITKTEKISKKVTACVCFISIGGIMSSSGRTSITSIGIVLSILSSICESLRLLLSQRLLCNLNIEPFEAILYMSFNCSLIMFIICIPLEIIYINYAQLTMDVFQNILLCGFLGLIVNFISVFIIKHISSIVLKLIGTTRNAGLVLFSVLFLKEEVTILQFSGYCLSVFSFFVYNYLKMFEETT